MADLLKQTKSVLQKGDSEGLSQFYQRDDVQEFLDNISDDSGCGVLKVSIISSILFLL